jgi:hypothetical protein
VKSSLCGIFFFWGGGGGGGGGRGNSAGMFYNILEKYATKNLNFGTSLLHRKWVLLGLFHIL